MTIEKHPFEPFLPEKAKILMLGSFPPPANRWSMDFYYPNFTNDMWRIAGLVFFNDRDRFIAVNADGSREKRFDKEAVARFCEEYGIAMYDTACEVIRLKGNASDKFLQVHKSSDIRELLSHLPQCSAIITTGEKAASVIAEDFGCPVPPTGNYSTFTIDIQGSGRRDMKLYRLPSSSRAYPLALDKKAEAYRKMFSETGVLNLNGQ